MLRRKATGPLAVELSSVQAIDVQTMLAATRTSCGAHCKERRRHD
jgi:hypothetical protein